MIFQHCAACHHPDGSAPFSLLSYQGVKNRAEQITAVTETRYMPPWLPDGSRRQLLYIPDWNFDWQDCYRYSEPVLLPEGTTVAMRFSYDNSAGNPRNPNHPPRRVVEGSATTDEMGNLSLQILAHNRQDEEELNSPIFRRNCAGGLSATHSSNILLYFLSVPETGLCCRRL